MCAIRPFDLLKLDAMSKHIGLEIKSIFEKKGMTVSEFGRRINKSRENVYNIFKRETIDTGLLEKISTVLEHDFFTHYTSLVDEINRIKEENQNLKDALSFYRSKDKKD